MKKSSGLPELRLEMMFQLWQLAQQTLAPAQLLEMERWNYRLGEDSYPMLPTAYRTGQLPMTPELYERTLRETDAWMNEYMRHRVVAYEVEKRHRRRDRNQQEKEVPGCIVLHFGIGVGRGMAYLKYAADHGLKPQLYDWSEVAIQIGRHELARVLRKDESKLELEDLVRWAEITQFFSSDHWEDEARFTRIAQLAFILEHLKDADREMVVVGVGRMLADFRNQLVIMDTPFEGNERFGSTTSKRRSRLEMEQFLLATLARGAGREVVLFDREEYVNPAEQHLVAWTFRGL